MITTLDEKTALVLVDLQKGIVAYPSLAGVMPGLLANSAKLAEAFRKAGKPVVLINVDPGDARWGNARKDSPSNHNGPIPPEMLEIAAEVGAQPDDIYVTKHSWGAFWETELHDELQKRGITQIVLGGIATSIGVEATARQAAERRYNISFATDIMADMVPSAHEHSIKVIFPRLGEVGTTDDIIAKL